MRRTAQRVPDKVALLVPDKSDFIPVTYREMFDTVRRFASVLQLLGLQRGERVGILAENCVEWAYTDWACFCLGIIVVPIYPTLPADQVEVIVRDAQAATVIVGDAGQRQKVVGLDGVRAVLLRGDADSLAGMAAGEQGTQLTEAAFHTEIDQATHEDLASLIYTSGTTGQPKGAMMPHRAFMHVGEAVTHHLPIDERDTFLTILPMSHVYERVCGQIMPVYLGATIGYAKSLASVSTDLQKVRPTVMLCVPRFLEAFAERALEGVRKMPPLRQRLFAIAMDQGVRKAQGKPAPLADLLDKLVMTKLRERVGGRMRFFVSGGAALAPKIAEFYMGTGLTVLQGYGLTETSGGSVVNRPDRNKYWTVGEPLGMEVKLAEDNEILLRGPGNFVGYWNMPNETAAAVDADGWFHTGDIGEWEGKSLKIVDRKKDILVLANGKNVAPQSIENKLKGSAYIAEAVVLGDGMDHCVALIIPKFESVRSALNLPDGAVLSESEEARALIKKEVDRINKSLASFELVKRHAILDAPFSIENGELTPSLKVKRKVIRERYAARISELTRKGL